MSELDYGSISGGTASCNDSWPAELPAQSQLSFDRNLNVDPVFCGEPEGNLAIDFASACAPAHAPDGCGLIGALQPACVVQSVESTTWGRVKASFR